MRTLVEVGCTKHASDDRGLRAEVIDFEQVAAEFLKQPLCHLTRSDGSVRFPAFQVEPDPTHRQAIGNDEATAGLGIDTDVWQPKTAR